MRELNSRREAAIATARVVLVHDRSGRPAHPPHAIAGAIDGLLRSGKPDAIGEFLVDGFLAESADRYAQYVAPHMRAIGSVEFQMGTSAARARHFCGESPRHTVTVSSFAIADIPVTNELYALFDRDRSVPIRDRGKPVVGVSWFCAAAFALWMGCRLPTEAEWEYACGAGFDGEWCCALEDDLRRYAWYSENADGVTHRVATREPNILGLYDMHGNVWEWCWDAYDPAFYERARAHNPRGAEKGPKVVRGGSLHALAEMCRTRYRQPEPADFWADDIGFRLTRSLPSEW